MAMHKDVETAFEQIDAAMFSGDAFMSADGRTKLREYLARWNKYDQENCYYAQDGTFMNADGSRNIFDDVDE